MQTIETDAEGGASAADIRLTVDEIRAGIVAMSAADLARLTRAGQVFSAICGISGEDLVQEACVRALEGRRTCDRDVGIVPFLCGVMKSIASQETEARKKGFRPVTVLRDGQPVLPEVGHEGVSPEDEAIAAIDDRPRLLRIAKIVEGDEKLEFLVEGLLEGWRGSALCEFLGVDERGLAALRRRLSRILASAGIGRTST